METPKKFKYSSPKCTTPTFQNLSYRETFHFGSETLHRSFSYNQLWSPGKDGNVTAVTQVTVSCCKTPSTTLQRHKRKKLTYEDSGRKKLKTYAEAESKLKVTMLLTVGAIGAILFGLNSIRCGDKVLQNGVREKLHQSLYDQEKAVSYILNGILDAKYESDVNKKHTLLAFVGPVGVGKSYAANIIKEYFPNKNSIAFTSAHDVIMNRKLPILRSICWKLIVIDDCKDNNVESILNILNSYESNSANTLVILSITSQNHYATNRLLQHMVTKIIYFSSLSADSVEKCFIRELEHYSYKLNAHELSMLVNDHMQPTNEADGPPGCKLVNEKIVKYFAQIGYDP